MLLVFTNLLWFFVFCYFLLFTKWMNEWNEKKDLNMNEWKREKKKKSANWIPFNKWKFLELSFNVRSHCALVILIRTDVTFVLIIRRHSHERLFEWFFWLLNSLFALITIALIRVPSNNNRWIPTVAPIQSTVAQPNRAKAKTLIRPSLHPLNRSNSV